MTDYSPSNVTSLWLLTWQFVTHTPTLSFLSIFVQQSHKLLLGETVQSWLIYLPERESELSLHFPTGLSSCPLPESILLGTVWSYWSGRNSQTEGANQGYWDGGPRHAPKRCRRRRSQHNLGSFCWLATLGLMGRECKALSRAKFGGVWSERQTVWRGRG